MNYIAEIKWLKPEEGGRETEAPFNSDKYGPQIRFDGLKGSWSLIVCNYQKLGAFRTLAKVHYLNKIDAPNNLKIGLEFDLYEGVKKVAHGEIIDII
ncbi:MAG: hypothetical protein IJX70_00430 [Clostridia bacterium]|nr:hypothetical protein [Clostridia bacterium]